jgi:hypothetical protein
MCIEKNECAQFKFMIIGKYTISLETNQWKSGQKVLQYTQDNKVCMLINKILGNLEFLGYSNLDIKVSTSCHILTLTCGVLSWKISKMTLMVIRGGQ